MPSLKICRICLGTEVKLYKYNNYRLKEYYEQIMASKIDEEEIYSLYFCYECAALLHKFHKFKEKCYKGEKVLKELNRRGPITLKVIHNLDRQTNNLQSSLNLITINHRVKTYVIKSKAKPKLIKDEEPIDDDLESVSTTSDNNNFVDDFSDTEEVPPLPELIDDDEKIEDGVEQIKIVKTETIEDTKIPLPEEVTEFVKEFINEVFNNDVNMPIDDTPIESTDKEKEVVTKKKEHTKVIEKKNKIKKVNKTDNKTKKSKITDKKKPELDSKNWLKFILSEEEAIEEFKARAQHYRFISAEYKCHDCLKGFSKEDMLNRHVKLRHSELRMENTVRTFITKRGGIKLNVDGFIYEKNLQKENKYYWVCEMRRNNNYKCNSRLITKLNDDQQHEILSKHMQNHNHEPNALREKIQIAVNRIKEDAKLNPTMKPIEIIANCEAITSPSISCHLPSNSNLKQIIYKQKGKNNSTKEPQDIDFELNTECLLKEYDQIITIDKKYDTNKRIIIFTTKKLITLLCLSKYIMMDGTFKVVPKMFYQLYTIHGNVENDISQTFPCILALCTNKDKTTYNILFTSIIEYCDANNLHLSPRFILMDFDKTAHICARQFFENTTIKGCNFHLGQIIYRHVQKNGLQRLYGNDISFAMEIKCLYALAFLPEEDIPIYFDDWKKAISPESETIANWFDQNYVWGTISSPPPFPPKVWSTYLLEKENIPRTQNHAEAWHNRFAHFVGKHHPGFYFLAKKIVQEIKHQTIEIDKLDVGTLLIPKKKKKYTDKTNRIEKIISKKDEYTSKLVFLQAIAKNIHLK